MICNNIYLKDVQLVIRWCFVAERN